MKNNNRLKKMDDSSKYIPLSQVKNRIKIDPLSASEVQDFFDDIKKEKHFPANIWLKNNVLAGLLYSYKSLQTYNSFLKLLEPEHKTIARILLYYTAFFGIISLICFQGRYLKLGFIAKYQPDNDSFICKPWNPRRGSHELAWEQFKKLFFQNPNAASEWDLTIQHIFQMEYDFRKVRNKINYEISGGFDEIEDSLHNLRNSIIWTLPSYDSILDINGNNKKSPVFLIDLESNNLIERYSSEEAYTRLILIASLIANKFFVVDNKKLYSDLHQKLSFVKSGKNSDLFPEF